MPCDTFLLNLPTITRTWPGAHQSWSSQCSPPTWPGAVGRAWLRGDQGLSPPSRKVQHQGQMSRVWPGRSQVRRLLPQCTCSRKEPNLPPSFLTSAVSSTSAEGEQLELHPQLSQGVLLSSRSHNSHVEYPRFALCMHVYKHTHTKHTQQDWCWPSAGVIAPPLLTMMQPVVLQGKNPFLGVPSSILSQSAQDLASLLS